MLRLILMVVFFISLSGHAHAAVDLKPVLNNLLTAITAVLLTASTVVVRYGIKWLSARANLQHSQYEEALAARVDAILHRAIDYASTNIKHRINDPRNARYTQVDFDSFFFQTAVGYAVSNMPDLIEYFQLDEQRITNMIYSRLNALTENPVPNSNNTIIPVPELNKKNVNNDFANEEID